MTIEEQKDLALKIVKLQDEIEEQKLPQQQGQ